MKVSTVCLKTPGLHHVHVLTCHTAGIFAIFAIKHQLAKFVAAKIFSSNDFLLTRSRAQFLRAADPVNLIYLS